MEKIQTTDTKNISKTSFAFKMYLICFGHFGAKQFCIRSDHLKESHPGIFERSKS